MYNKENLLSKLMVKDVKEVGIKSYVTQIYAFSLYNAGYLVSISICNDRIYTDFGSY